MVASQGMLRLFSAFACQHRPAAAMRNSRKAALDLPAAAQLRMIAKTTRTAMFGWRKRIGYIGPTVMEVVPYEFYRFAPDGVGLVGVTCGIDDLGSDQIDRQLAQATAAAAYLSARAVDFIVLGGGPLVVAHGKAHADIIVKGIE